MDAENTHQVFEWLWSSGQLSANDIAKLPALGIEAVINLALPTSSNALVGEAELVTGQGLTYIHIPVQWEKPNPEQFFEFAGVLQAFSGRKIWVHCAKNMRVSTFIYLFRKLVLGESEETAFFPMQAVWCPNETWQSFISQVCKMHSNPSFKRDAAAPLNSTIVITNLMPSLKPPTTLEKLAGSLSAEAALTTIAVATGTPIAALLPILGKSLAANRQKERVEATLREMNSILARHEAQLENLTDQQYTFINEAVLALLHTTNVSKMKLLRDVVQNSLSASELPDQEAVFLSRIIRDISTEEAQFLLANFFYQRIWLSELEPGDNSLPTLPVKPATLDGQSVLGLLTLGLVANAEPTFDDMGLLKFTPMAAKLIALLREPNA